MARADFIHEVGHIKGRDVISVIDLNLGNMSVTNDIENVVRDIEVMEKVDAKKYLIVYQDSEGVWDGWDPKSGEFVALTAPNFSQAVERYIQKQITV
jgi:hypothetical protein